MLGEVPGLTSAMQAALNSDEFRVRQIVPGSQNRNLGGNRFEVDLSSPAGLAEMHEAIVGPEGAPVGALVNFLGLAEPFCLPGCREEASPLQLTQWVFNVIKQFETDLRTGARRGSGWVLNVTSLDGKFGLGTRRPLPVAQAATIGLFKSISKEWPEAWVRNLDLDPEMDAELLFAHLIEEIGYDDGLVEVGISQNTRWTVRHVDQTPGAGEPVELPVDSESVVLATGGAGGITAEVLKELARRARPHLILVGRSPLPAEEPEEIRPLADAASLRKHLILAMRRDDPNVTPAAVEQVVQRTLKQRAIRANIAAMREAGSAVEYHSVDVRDPAAFAALIDQIYHRYGRLDGVVHGAGIIEDKRIGEKTCESLTRVVSTKVSAARVLAEKLDGDSLKFLVFFSSDSGRFGNAGQVDYSAANEYLNKLAVELNACWPARVVAINWGPWAGGMVTDELRRLYESHGVQLIPVRDGTRMFLSELSRNGQAAAEVLVACNIDTIAAGAGETAR